MTKPIELRRSTISSTPTTSQFPLDLEKAAEVWVVHSQEVPEDVDVASTVYSRHFDAGHAQKSGGSRGAADLGHGLQCVVIGDGNGRETGGTRFGHESFGRGAAVRRRRVEVKVDQGESVARDRLSLRFASQALNDEPQPHVDLALGS